jgi:hypothetical protein
MTLQTFFDGFDLPISPGGTTSVRTGYGFQPKLLFCICGDRGANGFISQLSSFGACTAAGVHRNIAWKIPNSSGTITTTSSVSTSRFGATYSTTAGSTTIDTEWDVSAIGSDGVTIRVSTATAGGTIGTPAIRILALGGSALANAAMGSFTLQDPPATTVVSSLSFAPDAVIFFSSTGYGGLGIGAASKRDGRSATTSNFVDTGTSTPAALHYTRSGECISTLSAGSTGLQRGQLSAWRGDGFEVTSLDNPLGTVNQTVHYVAIQMAPGFSCQIADLFSNNATGAISQPISGGLFSPLCGILASSNNTGSTAGVATVTDRTCIGMFNGTSSTQQASVAWTMDDHGSATQLLSYFSSTSAYVDSGNGSTMSITSMTKNNIICNQNSADVASLYSWALCFGSVLSGGGSPIFF